MKDCFGDYTKPTLEEFRFESEQTYTDGRLSLYEYSQKLDVADPRHTNFDSWSQILYTGLIENFEYMMRIWFEKHIAVKDLDNFLRFNVQKTNKEIENGYVIDGRKEITSGRLLRNISYKGIYQDTGKSNSSEKCSLLNTFTGLAINKFNISCLLTPKVAEFLEHGRYDDFFAILRGTSNRASIFNPYTYSWILNNVFPDGKKLLSPVMSWCSPVIGLANSNYDEMVAIDVIPDVVEKSRLLHEYSEGLRNGFFVDDSKQAEFYCCPSEQLDNRHNFSKKYAEHFDTVFFSPPYYDLEVYTGGEQSHESFQTYGEWLEGYWRPTVELCHRCLKPGATFSFVIVHDYGAAGKKTPISDDMKKIACDYFEYDKLLNISWGGFSAAEGASEKRKGLLENLHIMKKANT
jgi:hypothetical protein|tara:strand:- start:329 stop:1543 length:1215 start_codon:yes stop_codon:yes gene_type:complete